jgi:DNA-binding XRE family transcriptional regulator
MESKLLYNCFYKNSKKGMIKLKKEYKLTDFTLLDLRRMANKTQTEMGKILGLSEPGYRKKETAKSKLLFEEAKKIMEAFDLSYDEIDKIIENTLNNKK